jgi:hypothetical protein
MSAPDLQKRHIFVQMCFWEHHNKGDAKKMRPSGWLDHTRSALSSACMLLVAAWLATPSVATAEGLTLLPTEKVPTFLGIDLPLHPGEQLVPIGNSGCSAVEVADGPEDYRDLAGNRKGLEWIGGCRFGLMHGEGFTYLPGVNSSELKAQAIYGIYFHPTLVSAANGYQYYTFYAGSSLSGPNARKLTLTLTTPVDAQPFESLEDVLARMIYLRLDEYDEQGRMRNFEIRVESISSYCEADAFAHYGAFAPEARKACKNYPNTIVFQREGSSALYYKNALVGLKACPKSRKSRAVDCEDLIREAIGKDISAFNEIIAGDKVARQFLRREVFDRYAPLEAAVEARAKQAAEGRTAP